MNPGLPAQTLSPLRGEGRDEGRLARALAGCDDATRALLLATLLRQAQHWEVEVGAGAHGMQAVRLRMDFAPATLAALLDAEPSPQALAVLIGLASI